VSPYGRLRRLRNAPLKQIALELPAPIGGRLDGLLIVADAADERTTRRELIAAIIHDTRVYRHRVVEVLTEYRNAEVSKAFIPGQPQKRFLAPRIVQGPRQLAPRERPSTDERPTKQLPPIKRDDLLSQAGRYRVGAAIPVPVDRELDALVERAKRQGERTSRRELVAALILAAPHSPDALAEILRSYRRATIGRRLRGRRHTAPDTPGGPE
jgi:hypothetical protein